MKKISLIFTTILLSVGVSLASIYTSFDRAIFFGDSLSDIGNFPEPKNYFTAEKKDIPLYNLYVPISSPVDSILYGKSFKILSSDVEWKYPNNKFLKEVTTFEGKINDENKKYKSINWIEYLVYNNFVKHLLPSSKVYKHKDDIRIDKNVSVDYAWAGALSIDGFGDDSQNIIKGGYGQDDILKIKDKYIEEGGLSSSIVIPGMRKQVEYYIDNLNKGLVPKDIDTAYFILIGGNDIAETLRNDLMGLHLLNFWKKIGSTNSYGTIAKNVKSSVDELISNPDIKAKHIYVLTLFDLANLPSVYNQSSNFIIRNILQDIMTHTVSSYNKQLYKIFSAKEYSGKVTVLPIAKDLNKLAKEARFSRAVNNGLTCIDNVTSADHAKPNINNCNYNINQETYFAWNNSHLTTIVNQVMAYKTNLYMDNENKIVKADINDSQDQKKLSKLVEEYISVSNIEK